MRALHHTFHQEQIGFLKTKQERDWMKSGFIVILNPILFAKIHKQITYL